ncbi:3-phosphoshikimate 1-carboxyvinyltransferase, partial [bacterium]|nr:3-phosphoshikimate 1-carboxyvinyltransferase [bacterium]
MKNQIYIKEKIKKFNYNKIYIPGDKSLSIRFIILSSLASGRSVANNLLMSEDVKNAINCIKKMGIKINLKKNYCEVFGKGLWGYKYKNNLLLNSGNSGTTARLISATVIDSKKNIKITGDNSLKKRDMLRII